MLPCKVRPAHCIELAHEMGKWMTVYIPGCPGNLLELLEVLGSNSVQLQECVLGLTHAEAAARSQLNSAFPRQALGRALEKQVSCRKLRSEDHQLETWLLCQQPCCLHLLPAWNSATHLGKSLRQIYLQNINLCFYWLAN